jgi:protein-tyrosine kinase
VGLIEQAARRLEELRRAGIDIPDAPGWQGDAPLRQQPVAEAARAAPAQPAWWADTVPSELADAANEEDVQPARPEPTRAPNGHGQQGHKHNGHAQNGQGHNGQGHNGHRAHGEGAWSAQAPIDLAETVMQVMPSARRSVAARRDSSLDRHEDRLPDQPVETDVATEQATTSKAVMVREQRSARVGMDVLRMARDGYLVPGVPQAEVAEEFRGIKRALLRSIGEAAQLRVRRPNLVMVTSARPKEGKTFVALNLALSIAAEVDHSALLVDLDSVQSAVMTRTGLPSDQPGVIDLLTQAGRLPVSQVMLATQIPKLSLLPAGSANSHASELLSSVAMDALLDDLARRYPDRVVIFDAPPLLGATEVAMLASQMGQVLMVVSQEQTPLEDVRRAFDKVIDCPRVMSVFNRAATLGVVHGRARPEAAHA